MSEWLLATPALHMCETVDAHSADDAIEQVWVSGFFEEKLDELMTGTTADHLFGGYMHTFVFPVLPSESGEQTVTRYDLRLRFEEKSLTGVRPRRSDPQEDPICGRQGCAHGASAHLGGGRCRACTCASFVQPPSVAPGSSGFDADTRLLTYFGRLHRAASALCNYTQGGWPLPDAEPLNGLREAIALPPDIEAAVEGPRGRE